MITEQKLHKVQKIIREIMEIHEIEFDRLDIKLEIGDAVAHKNGLCDMTLEFKEKVGDEVIDPRQKFWEEGAAYYGVGVDWWGKTFMFEGHTYKVTELNTRRSKYRIGTERVSDKSSWSFPVYVVKPRMEKKD